MQSSLDVPTIATRRLHACHHARAPSGGRWNYGREISGNFAEMTISTPFRDLLHAAATTWDRRLYFPFEGRRAEHFFALKIPRLRPGVNPRTWVPKASTLPLDHQTWVPKASTLPLDHQTWVPKASTLPLDHQSRCIERLQRTFSQGLNLLER